VSPWCVAGQLFTSKLGKEKNISRRGCSHGDNFCHKIVVERHQSSVLELFIIYTSGKTVDKINGIKLLELLAVNETYPNHLCCV
jgi:hypothetical protein